MYRVIQFIQARVPLFDPVLNRHVLPGRTLRLHELGRDRTLRESSSF